LKTIGVIGAGQLGQMLGLAAAEVDMECVFLDPADNPPASSAGRVIQAAFDDAAELAALADCCDVITYEFENVPVDAVRAIEAVCPVYPPPSALAYAQDRLSEKRLFESLQIPVAPYRRIDSAKDLQQASEDLGLPLVVKTRRLGYDGKGQAILRNPGDAAEVVAILGGQNLIAEQFVEFDYEVSIIGARSTTTETIAYDLSRNEHRDGILRMSHASDENPQLGDLAKDYLSRILSRLDYVGVLALELFVDGEQLLANEFAPRVHNSGHWSIEGARTSQFENHLRAISGMPLGDASTLGFPGMVNIIGMMPEDRRLICAENAFLHDYGKTPRPGRKLGHATIVASSATELQLGLSRLRDLLPD